MKRLPRDVALEKRDFTGAAVDIFALTSSSVFLETGSGVSRLLMMDMALARALALAALSIVARQDLPEDRDDLPETDDLGDDPDDLGDAPGDLGETGDNGGRSTDSTLWEEVGREPGGRGVLVRIPGSLRSSFSFSAKSRSCSVGFCAGLIGGSTMRSRPEDPRLLTWRGAAKITEIFRFID